MADQERKSVAPSNDLTGRGAPTEDPGRKVEVSEKDRAEGVVSQRETSIVGNSGAAEEAGLAGTGGGQSRMFGAEGSGSTTTTPSGAPGPENNEGTVSGTTGLGAGGTAPSGSTSGGSTIVDSGVRGAGARPDPEEKTDR